MKNSRIYTLFIISISFFNGFSQDIAQTYNLAKQFYELRQYKEASNLLSRVIYFADDSILSLAYGLKAECSYRNGEFENAANEYHIAAQIDKLPNQIISYQFSECLSLVRLKRFLGARELLLQLDTLILGEKHKDSWYTLMGTTFWFDGGEDSAFSYFNCSMHTEEQKNALAEIRIQTKKQLKLSPKKAEIFAALFPGTGHFYSGDIKGGMNSFILTIGLAALATKVAYTVGPINAILAVAPWYYRYYIGGTKNAAYVASQKREGRKVNLYNRIILLLN